MKIVNIAIALLIPFLATSQVLNDECEFATPLGFTTNFCSGPAGFTNEGATLSPEAIPFCFFGGAASDVWFSFTPTLSGGYISVSGELASPSIVVYEGFCANLTEIGCESRADGNFVELSLSDLLIGQTYFLRVDGRNGEVGSFELCINSFSPTMLPESDCRDAVVLCDKSPFVVENLNSTGNVQNELTGPCVGPGQDGESASVWYVWTCDQPGTLTFTLDPNNPNNNEEDLDFVVYELPGGLTDCANRVPIRCMLSGESGGVESSPCFGPTGLNLESTDTQETAGCSFGDDNFVAALDMVSGVSYGMIINNFSTSGFGFSIEFGGSGTFLGPEPDFEIEALAEFECDKTILFNNLSESLTDEIISYSWNFGSGATPSFGTGSQQQSVEYNSFGNKVAALTVETERGCLVTTTVNFFVEPCCQDTSTLRVEGEGFDLQCFGDLDGLITGEGFSGSPQYQFALNDGAFQPNPFFPNLGAGIFDLTIIDIKGCSDTITIDITQPTQTTVDAGPDVTVDLGESGQIDASVFSDFFVDSIMWSPLDSFVDCTECLDPTVFPFGNTTYTITVTDENGCTATDEVQFLVNIVRPVFSPNVFSPNEDNTNDFFNIFGGSAVAGIESLKVYNRWGNLVYEGTPQLNNRNDGWDGTHKGIFVNPDVYAWIASIRFIDFDENGQPVVIDFTGDVTVLR